MLNSLLLLQVRLSHTIATTEWITSFLKDSIPQAKHIYAFMIYDDHTITGYNGTDELPTKKLEHFTPFLQQANSGWYSKEETPIAYKKKLGQTGLEGELNRDCLFIRQKTMSKQQLSLLIQFRPFSLSKNHYLSSGEKKVIESLVSGMTNQLIRQQESDKQLMVQIARSADHLKQDVQKMREQIAQTNKQYEQSIKQLLSLLFKRLESLHEIKINYTPTFIQAVMQFSGDFKEMEQHLEKQVAISANLAQLTGEHDMWLDESNLRTFKSQLKRRTKSPANLPINLGRLNKAHALLDRYEQAAAKVLEQGLSVIGKHVGSHCSPPISNAAITDALGKNAKKIYELFERFPEKWPIIRKEFRSVVNVMERETQRRQTG